MYAEYVLIKLVCRLHVSLLSDMLRLSLNLCLFRHGLGFLEFVYEWRLNFNNFAESLPENILLAAAEDELRY